MKFKKIKVKRDIEELLSDMDNIVNAANNVFQDRVVQFIKRIENSDFLTLLFKPYFEMEIDEIYGFHSYNEGFRIEYKLPQKDDEEIATILQFLRDNSIGENVKENHMNNIAHGMFHHNRFDDNISELNYKIISPTFEKLKRKLEYKLEDLEEIDNNEIDLPSVTIVSIENVSNSNIAIGDNINQQLFGIDEIKNEITVNEELDIKMKDELLNVLNEIKENTRNKKNTIISIIDLLIKYSEQYKILRPIALKIIDLIFNLKIIK